MSLPPPLQFGSGNGIFTREKIAQTLHRRKNYIEEKIYRAKKLHRMKIYVEENLDRRNKIFDPN